MISRLTSSRVGYGLSAVLILALFVGGYAIGTRLTARPAPPTPTPAPSGAGVVSPPHQVQDFTLTSHTGDPINLSDLRGKAVLMLFGYTHCPDVCPTTLATYTRVKEALGDAADDVEFVMISVDGARDTPDVMANYLANFDPAFIGMTGTPDELERVGAEYGLVTERVDVATEEPDHDHADTHTEDVDSDHYFVEHTSPSFLIDPDGYLRLVYFYGAQPDAMATGIQQVLSQPIS